MFWIHKIRLSVDVVTPDFEEVLRVFEGENVSELCYWEENGEGLK